MVKKKIYITILIGCILTLLGGFYYLNKATATTWTTGTSNYFSISNDLSITGGNISMGCWAKSNDTTGEQVISIQVDGGVSVSYYLEIGGAANTVDFTRNKRAVGAPQANADTVLPATGEWFYLAGTYDGTTLTAYMYKAYTNQWKKGTNTDSGSGNAGWSDFSGVGAYLNGGVNWIGQISNCFVYNVALTEAQIHQLAFQRPPSNDSGLVALWKLDEGEGSTAYDYSLKGNNLTKSGTPPPASNYPPVAW